MIFTNEIGDYYIMRKSDKFKDILNFKIYYNFKDILKILLLHENMKTCYFTNMITNCYTYRKIFKTTYFKLLIMLNLR